MSLQPASLGAFYLGPQTAKGTPQTTDANLYGYKANLVDVAPAQMFRNIGQLVGSSLLPGGTIKTAAWSGGGLVLPPPLEDYIGWLLYAFAGSVSSVDNGDSTYSHFFPSGVDETAPAKYLTAFRKIPGSSVLWEQMDDMVLYRLLFGLTPGEYGTLRADMIGRAAQTTSEPFTGAADNPPEDETSVPIASRGTFELPDGSAISTAKGVTLELANVIPDLRRVLVMGSYYPFDFPVLNRAITASFSFMWENSTLYESLYYSGGVWTPITYSGTFEMTVQSPDNITGAAVPYKLEFYAPNIDWSCQPVRLAGGDLVEIAMAGTVADAGSAYDHDWYLELQNGVSAYTWPS